MTKVVHKIWNRNAKKFGKYEANDHGELLEPCCPMCLRKYANTRFLNNHLSIMHPSYEFVHFYGDTFRFNEAFLLENQAEMMAIWIYFNDLMRTRVRRAQRLGMRYGLL